MQLKILILSIACFATLVPPAWSMNLMAVKAVAGQAAQDIAAIKAATLAAKKQAMVDAASDIISIAASGALLKGQALKTAASSIAGAMINGALSIGATIAKAGVNMVAAKFSAKPILFPLQESNKIVPENDAVEHKPAIKGPVNAQPVKVVSPANSPYIYEIIEVPRGAPRVITGPFQRIQFKK